jgi:hypothetical protein
VAGRLPYGQMDGGVVCSFVRQQSQSETIIYRYIAIGETAIEG